MKINLKNKKVIIGGSIILILIVAAIFKSKKNNQPLEVETHVVKKGNITETVSASGKIEPVTLIKIAAEISGEIIEVAVEEGMQVQKGDLLIKINPELYTSALQRAEAGLNTSKANLANAKARLAQSNAQLFNAEANFKRNEQLFKQGAISQAEFDQIKATFMAAKADVEAATESVEASKYQVKSAEAGIKEAGENLRRTTIYAPMTGTISSLNVEVGERVLGTLQNMGSELLRIADLSEMEVKVDVNENDIVRIHRLDTALIEIDAYPDRKFKGVVTKIANSSKSNNALGAASNNDQVANFEVKILILKSSYQDLLDPNKTYLSPFRPGMSATVEIKTLSKNNIIIVPIQAVTTREDTTSKDDKTDEVIFTFNDGLAQPVKVKTGIQDNKFIEVKTGLEENTEIISGPYSIVSKELKPDKKVVKKKKD